MSEIDTRIESITKVLEESKTRIKEIEGMLLVTREGLPISSTTLPNTTDEDRMAAMSAAALNLAERVVEELEKGMLKEMVIKGDSGLILVVQVGEEAVLTATTSSDAKLGLILLELKRTAKSVVQMLAD